jgi:hypothetical protein
MDTAALFVPTNTALLILFADSVLSYDYYGLWMTLCSLIFNVSVSGGTFCLLEGNVEKGALSLALWANQRP